MRELGWGPQYTPIAEAVVRLTYPHVEVVLHDIGTDSAVATCHAPLTVTLL